MALLALPVLPWDEQHGFGAILVLVNGAQLHHSTCFSNFHGTLDSFSPLCSNSAGGMPHSADTNWHSSRRRRSATSMTMLASTAAMNLNPKLKIVMLFVAVAPLLLLSCSGPVLLLVLVSSGDYVRPPIELLGF